MLSGMARVRLNAGALTAAQVRMGSRGASERLRPPGDDINTGGGANDRLVCALCGSTRKVDASRPRRCGPCRSDEQTVRDASARLKAAGQPPLGGGGNKADFAQVRKQGEAARARLAERKRGKPRPADPSPRSAPAVPSSPRRMSPAQKQAGARRLKTRIERMEQELRTLLATDKRRAGLREDLGIARQLLTDWEEGVF